MGIKVPHLGKKINDLNLVYFFFKFNEAPKRLIYTFVQTALVQKFLQIKTYYYIKSLIIHKRLFIIGYSQLANLFIKYFSLARSIMLP